MKTARPEEYTRNQVMFLAFELSAKKWKVGTTIGIGQKPRERSIDAGDLEGLLKEIAEAKARFGLPADTRVVSCYEAGRDGFWLDRWLRKQKIENVVIDPASVHVDRRKRKAKTDRLDLGKLLRTLIRWYDGEPKMWSVVRVPSVEDEDDRQLHRELQSLKKEQTRHVNRIKSLLVSQGVKLAIRKNFVEMLKRCRLWDGSPLPEHLVGRLEREYQRLEIVRQQILQLEAERREALKTSTDENVEKVRQMKRLRGIGIESSWLFVMEFFGWREFKNRRQVGSLAGLTPTPHESGAMSRELGIDKAGNPRIRSMAIEIAWSWLRFQPQSELSLWFERRFGSGGKRARKIGIVALARRLLVALWRFVDQGVVPAGAVLTR
jgi:transposase